MAEVTVKQLADEVGIPVDRLLTQLGEAGIDADTEETAISDTDKLQLLQHLRSARQRQASSVSATGDDPARRISLRRKSTSEIKLGGTNRTRSRTISVEVRKRRTYMRRNEEKSEQSAPQTGSASPEQQDQPVAKGNGAGADHEVGEQARDQQPAATTVEAPSSEPEHAAEAQSADSSPAAEAEQSEPAAEQTSQSAQEETTGSDADEDESKTSAGASTEQEADTQQTPSTAALEQVDSAAAEPAATDGEPAEHPHSGEAEKARAVAPRSHGKDASPVDAGRAEMQATRRRAQENLRRASAKRHQQPDRDELEQAKRQELHVAKGKSGRRKKKSKAPASGAIQVDSRHAFEKPTAPVVRDVEIPEAINVGDLAQRMAVKAPVLIKQLMKMGVMATINQTLDQETAVLIVEEMGHKPHPIKEDSIEDTVLDQASAESEGATWEPRPPVVTVMGHVDHGKTSLLDYIRSSRVAAGESGGITQHIGAYHVDTPGGRVTFLDTPGHAAFTRMRARGAGITDIVVLIVAADDGVMPQTREAIEHARAAQVPMVVALTKIDREESDPDRVKNELAGMEIIPEEWGGDTQVVGVSAVTGEGVDGLLESLALQAEIMELKAPVDTPARGVVIESSLEKGRGPVATVLVKSGTLRQGDVVLSGRYFGRVRAMFDERGKSVDEIGASLPAEVLGLSGTPDAGEEVFVVADERKAREIAQMRETRERETKLAQQQATRLEEVFSQMESGERLALNVMVKADVHGSVEALAEALQDLSGEQIKIKIVARGVGAISESDVDLAAASDAIMIGFNVRADSKAKRRIQDTGVDVRYYSVIYNVINDVKDAASGMLGTETREQIVGTAEVRDVFKSSRLGAIAGSLVVDGSVRRGLPIRVLRDNVVIYEGELESLRRFKDDVDKVEAGTECGIGVKNYNDVRPGDQIENFDRIEVKRTL